MIIGYANKVESTLVDTCLCFKSIVTVSEMSSELICTESFDFTLKTPCIYATKVMTSIETDMGETLGYGGIRDEIASDASCFSGVGDGHYSGCDTVTPTLIDATVLVTSTGSDTSLTYTGEMNEANSCICFGKRDGSLTCTDPFGLTVEYPCSFTEFTVEDFELIYEPEA